jgi:hypothetical protein
MSEVSLRFEEITEAVFREFARRHGTSPEVGRIGTYLDERADGEIHDSVYLFGLFGCERLCAVTSCTIKQNANDRRQVAKLDAIIVDPELRRRGLAELLVCHAFLALLSNPEFDITRIYSFAVHPATVALLTRLSFSRPPATGAPICAVEIDGTARPGFENTCRSQIRSKANHLRIQCALCQKSHKRAKPWCGKVLRN